MNSGLSLAKNINVFLSICYTVTITIFIAVKIIQANYLAIFVILNCNYCNEGFV